MIGLFGVFFLVLNFLSSLYILEINALLEVHVVRISSQSVGSLLILLIVSFAEKNLSPSHLLILDFPSCVLGVLLRKSDPRPTW
uniref:Secreted protein n=1 Tax=Marmota marmota marmota TaxID=9994 RepID=A0A8C5Z0B7_MARMA